MKPIQLFSADGTALHATVELPRDESPVVILHGANAYIRYTASEYRETTVAYQPAVKREKAA